MSGPRRRWEHSSGRVTLTVEQFTPTACTIVWEITAYRTIPSLDLTFGLPALPPEAEWDWDSGEKMQAITITTPGLEMSLGGPDFEILEDTWPGTFLEPTLAGLASLSWRLPALTPGTTFRLHCAAAWAPPFPELGSWQALDDALMHLQRQRWSSTQRGDRLE